MNPHQRDYAPDYKAIPPHGRWQHFEVGGRPRVNQLLQTWPLSIDAQERTRRLIDLFLISVLLDAGAGNKWVYKSKESGKLYSRSEGLAVASLEMFKSGMFSSDPTEPCQVDGAGLKKLTLQALSKGMQHSERNPLAGIEGRAGVLARLAEALNNQEYFGVDARPGNMLGMRKQFQLLSCLFSFLTNHSTASIGARGTSAPLLDQGGCQNFQNKLILTYGHADYLISHPTTLASSVLIISVPTLWTVLMDGLSSIWPASRTRLEGVSLGDAWPCSSMPPTPPSPPWENIVPFHKLTQWLCYSLMAPMNRLMHIQFAGSNLLTGLPEYRNGGLLIDTGVLTLKEQDQERGLQAYRENAQITGQPSMEVVPMFSADDDAIVEWRAVTVGFLDDLLLEVNGQLGLMGDDALNLPQLLEAGTWKVCLVD